MLRAFSLPELHLMRFIINSCHGNTDRLKTCRLRSNTTASENKFLVEFVLKKRPIRPLFTKKGDSVTARVAWKADYVIVECWPLLI